MNKHSKNRFSEKIETAAKNNSKVDMNLIQEWQEMTKILEKIPPEPAPTVVQPPRLQPIPLRMFSQ